MHDALIVRRLDGKFDRTPGQGPKGECWGFTGYRDAAGYGRISIKGKIRPAHRIRLEIKLGRILTDEEMACHSCDYPPCGNPEHLFAGAAVVNTTDCISKGRFVAIKSPIRTHCRKGHELTETNVVIDKKDGRWRCRTCREDSERRRGKRR